jgi:hypothetical protein
VCVPKTSHSHTHTDTHTQNPANRSVTEWEGRKRDIAAGNLGDPIVYTQLGCCCCCLSVSSLSLSVCAKELGCFGIDWRESRTAISYSPGPYCVCVCRKITRISPLIIRRPTADERECWITVIRPIYISKRPVSKNKSKMLFLICPGIIVVQSSPVQQQIKTNRFSFGGST